MNTTLPDPTTLDARKAKARAWFESLRDDICGSFEALENLLPPGAPNSDRGAGSFVRTPWERTDHTGAQPISDSPEIGNVTAGGGHAPPRWGGGGVWVKKGRGVGKVGAPV